MKDLFNVENKVVLVTGGSSGIGEMIATGYVEAGSKVYITSRKANMCTKVASKLNTHGPGQCLAIPADLQKPDHLKHLVAEISQREDHLDVLINCAGAVWNERFDDFPDDAFEKVINLNLRRVFQLIQLCFPLLTAKASTSNPSSVINIGSVNGFGAVATETYSYTASKAGLHHMTRHMAGKLGHRGVTFNVVAPGAFQSKIMAETLQKHGNKIMAANPMGRIGTAEDIAGTCIYLSSRAGQHTNGAVIAVDGGSSWYASKW
ncbi:NAD(P)-binding protein [Lichtheimia hyalospora FSU 10163]|nr:NAD(P)-binding protein [Lichtheimia hyalospora FSU 10163]